MQRMSGRISAEKRAHRAWYHSLFGIQSQTESDVNTGRNEDRRRRRR